MKNNITFLFYHYGKIPKYLECAIEHVRLFNPSAEIYLITDEIKNTSKLNRFDVIKFQLEEFHSEELDLFKKLYQHVSCFNEKYERFVLERWFVTEIIRKQRPERTYLMLDSDVAVFGSVDDLINELPDFPIVLSGRNPHFTFIKGEISEFLQFITDYYQDNQKITTARLRFNGQKNNDQLYTLGEMQFLFEYLDLERGMRMYNVDTSRGFVDGNFHEPQGFDCLQLRRRPRKEVLWNREEGRAIPYFKRGDELVKAFILHFQGPGKRVFKRFNSIDGPTSALKIWWWNQIFQRQWLASLM
jgi:hypothetical protein